MRGCDDIRDRLEAFADGELGRREHAEVERHLGRCSTCRRAVDVLRGLDAELRAEVDSTDPGDGYFASLPGRFSRRDELEAIEAGWIRPRGRAKHAAAALRRRAVWVRVGLGVATLAAVTFVVVVVNETPLRPDSSLRDDGLAARYREWQEERAAREQATEPAGPVVPPAVPEAPESDSRPAAPLKHGFAVPGGPAEAVEAAKPPARGDERRALAAVPPEAGTPPAPSGSDPRTIPSGEALFAWFRELAPRERPAAPARIEKKEPPPMQQTPAGVLPRVAQDERSADEPSAATPGERGSALLDREGDPDLTDAQWIEAIRVEARKAADAAGQEPDRCREALLWYWRMAHRDGRELLEGPDERAQVFAPETSRLEHLLRCASAAE